MKAYRNRNYEINITEPQVQVQKINVGIWIRRTIGKGLLNTGPNALPIRTFRVRHGNGYAGTKLGELIQDQYDYFANDPNADHFDEEYKRNFAAAVAAWQALTLEDKMTWNRKCARMELHMTGYNLFLRNYLKTHIPTITTDLLQETNGYMYQENGYKINLEA